MSKHADSAKAGTTDKKCSPVLIAAKITALAILVAAVLTCTTQIIIHCCSKTSSPPSPFPSDFPFAVTRNFYGQEEDIETGCKSEFGTTATVADWEEIKSIHSDQPGIFVRNIAFLECALPVMVIRNHERLSEGERHYYMVLQALREGNPPIDLLHVKRNLYLNLRSWDSLYIPVLCRVRR